ncbi:MAG: phosphoenolpyruvate mutase [Lachnospiraceae bacterium]|nr:phosphoenolpyruvate mutase [Lachnospiraceae bacterium]
MKALILNSGMGTRMGVLTSEHPKCMTEISHKESILSRQLRMLQEVGIKDVVMTVGYYDNVLAGYCRSLELPVNITYIKNPLYKETNYIYSIYCARDYLDDDVLLLHGDMVLENKALDEILASERSCMAVSGCADIPDKDFKASIKDGRIEAIGVDLMNDVVPAYPVYKLNKKDWRLWLDEIIKFCEREGGEWRKKYAEEAFNRISESCMIYPCDIGEMLCAEIDDAMDLAAVSSKLKEVESRIVYAGFSTDVLHSGHLNIIRKAQRLGKVIAGILTDEAVSSYKRYPLLPCEERMSMFESISGVWKVVVQDSLSYRDNLLKYKPKYVVHGDDWKTGALKPVRDEVAEILASYGGELVEVPYSHSEAYDKLETGARLQLSMPDIRRGRLRKTISMKGLATAMEAHDGLTGLIVENTVVYQNGGGHQFDAMWVSSLCDSTAKGKPDIELLDMTARLKTVEDLMEITTKPIIFDGDTGGRLEHFPYTVKTLERMGVSMVIIEDKTGLKRNSLFGTGAGQTQDSIENFCEKIRAGKKACHTKDFMICARIESLILEMGMEDALTRAFAYVDAGADAIMIHSRRKDPGEIFEFVESFRVRDTATPLVVVPTSFNSVTEEEFKARGVNIVIYANQLMRATVPAIKKAAVTILENHRAKECDEFLMPFSEIIRMIPEEA